MSVKSEIERIQGNIAAAYSEVAEKGAELPEVQNSENLPGTIRGIPAGMTQEEFKKTIYQYAVDGGYTGTEAEFQTLLGTGPWLPKNGGELTGAVTVQAPTADMNPATKKYVDDAVNNIEASTGGGVSIPGGLICRCAIPTSAGMSGVPAGWVLCNGNNGTPSYMDKMEVHESQGIMVAYIMKENVDNAVNSLDMLTSGEAAIPSGLICRFVNDTSSSPTVPNGWVLCDGSNGTPDYTGDFAVYPSQNLLVRYIMKE